MNRSSVLLASLLATASALPAQGVMMPVVSSPLLGSRAAPTPTPPPAAPRQRAGTDTPPRPVLEPAPPPPAEANSWQTRTKGSVVRRAVRSLIKDLDWHKDLDKAQNAALTSGKPILWIQAFGDLKGYT